jgi:hypothetical protein
VTPLRFHWSNSRVYTCRKTATFSAGVVSRFTLVAARKRTSLFTSVGGERITPRKEIDRESGEENHAFYTEEEESHIVTEKLHGRIPARNTNRRPGGKNRIVCPNLVQELQLLPPDTKFLGHQHEKASLADFILSTLFSALHGKYTKDFLNILVGQLPNVMAFANDHPASEAPAGATAMPQELATDPLVFGPHSPYPSTKIP